MHEMALSQSMMRIVEEEAVRQAFARVKILRLEIGALSHVEPEAMAFCFEAVSKGTIAEGADLQILRPPGEAYCMTCEKTITLAARYDPCPHCQGHRLRVSGGEELRIKDMEVE